MTSIEIHRLNGTVVDMAGDSKLSSNLTPSKVYAKRDTTRKHFKDHSAEDNPVYPNISSIKLTLDLDEEDMVKTAKEWLEKHPKYKRYSPKLWFERRPREHIDSACRKVIQQALYNDRRNERGKERRRMKKNQSQDTTKLSRSNSGLGLGTSSSSASSSASSSDSDSNMHSRGTKQSLDSVFQTNMTYHRQPDVKFNAAKYLVYTKVECCKGKSSKSTVSDIIRPGSIVDVQSVSFAQWRKTIEEDISDLNLNKYNITSEVEGVPSFIKQDCKPETQDRNLRTAIIDSHIAGLPRAEFVLKPVDSPPKTHLSPPKTSRKRFRTEDSNDAMHKRRKAFNMIGEAEAINNEEPTVNLVADHSVNHQLCVLTDDTSIRLEPPVSNSNAAFDAEYQIKGLSLATKT